MWKLQAKLSLAVFAACTAIGIIYSLNNQGPMPWLAILAISGIMTAVFMIRSTMLVREERRRVMHRQSLFVDASNELIGDMARLSPGDLSVFVAQIQRADPKAIFCTARGSANHHVLVQMTNLGLAAPVGMQALSGSASPPVLAQYRLTPVGHASMASLLELVSRRKRALAGQLK